MRQTEFGDQSIERAGLQVWAEPAAEARPELPALRAKLAALPPNRWERLLLDAVCAEAATHKKAAADNTAPTASR